VETNGSIIRSTVVELLIQTEEQRTGSEARHVVIHSPIDRGLPVDNSTGRTATSAALTVGTWVIVAGSIVAIVIAVLQGIGAEALLESGRQVEIRLARAIALAAQAREIAAMEIELEVAM